MSRLHLLFRHYYADYSVAILIDKTGRTLIPPMAGSYQTVLYFVAMIVLKVVLITLSIKLL